MRNWLLMVGLASVVGIAAIVSLRSNASAVPVCNDSYENSELNGGYIYHGEGSAYVSGSSSSFEEDLADVGVLNFDGKGDIYGTTTYSARPVGSPNPGAVCTYNLTGNYCVNSGSATIDGTSTDTGCPPFDATVAFVIREHGRAGSWVFTSFSFTSTPPPTVHNYLESGDFHKQ